MLALLVWGKGGILELLALRRQIQKLESEVQGLREENLRLKAEIKALRENPQLYERPARERYFFKKPGEVILYLPPGEAAPAPSPGPGSKTP
ncbi:MAG: septum formation initiator family protein [Acidobacteriota bacterium]